MDIIATFELGGIREATSDSIDRISFTVSFSPFSGDAVQLPKPVPATLVQA
ncbi:hypothetical protein [Escherichia phage M01]|nr:hypothetical protein [Escherichia phage CR01]WKW35240.1 hypothetical protein [Escherichia phage M01]